MWWAATCWKVQWKDKPSGRRYSSGLSISWLGFVWWFPKFKTGGQLQPHWPPRGASYKRYPAKEIDIISIHFFKNPSIKWLGTKSRHPLNTWCSKPWVVYMIWDNWRSWYRTCFYLGIYRESLSHLTALWFWYIPWNWAANNNNNNKTPLLFCFGFPMPNLGKWNWQHHFNIFTWWNM